MDKVKVKDRDRGKDVKDVKDGRRDGEMADGAENKVTRYNHPQYQHRVTAM